MARIFPVEIISTQQMRRAESLAIEAGTESYALMVAAGRAVADEITEYVKTSRALVLCGPGNNGGDGFVVARLLKERGWQVRLACLAGKESLKGDAAIAAGEYAGEVASFEHVGDLLPDEVVVDAVFGTGLKGSLPPEVVRLFGEIRKARPPVIAVDIPSGVNGDTGEADEHALSAAMTVTFFRKKPGHVLMPGLARSGPTSVHEIGIKDNVLGTTGIAAYENHPVIWQSRIRRKSHSDNKYDFGHLVVSGGGQMTGAALLAAHAAMRMRTGVCTIAGPSDASGVYRSYLPSLMFEGCDDVSGLSEHVRNEKRTAALIGPGAGTGDLPGLRQAVIECCELGEDKGMVLDADAITAFQGRSGELFEVLHKRCVLTPHEGEFARLFDELEGIKPLRAIEAAALSGAVIVLKGSDTVIATPNGRCVISTNAPPLLATAGSGDVLAGMIAGLLAQKIPPFEASCAACWILGEAAYSFGPGLMSSDLPDLLPAVLRELP